MQCTKCGSPITKETRFCAGCGTALPAAQALGAGRHSAVTADEGELSELKELHDKKRRIGMEMRAILELAEQVGAAEADHKRYAELREEWTGLEATITERMQLLMERQTIDRRERASRSGARRALETEIRRQDRRSGGERRDDDRRSGPDRRDPFPRELS